MSLSFEQKLNQWEIEAWRNLRKQASNKDFEIQYRAFELGKSFKNLSLSQQRDFDYYLENARKERCYPNHFCVTSKFVYHPKTVEEWYYLWDTHGYGKEKELTQPNISDCEGIKQAKEFTNLTIKMWVEGIFDMTFFIDEAKEACKTMPEWVWKAFTNQVQKESINRYGFILTFIKKGVKSS